VIFTDTNILLRNLYPLDPQHPAAKKALATLRLRREKLCIAPQNLVEFWAVATRTQSENGLGMNTAQAVLEVAKIRKLFYILSYTPDVLEAWERLVAARGISGKQTHDAHIVAIMQVHLVTSILTFNDRHFKRYPEIKVLNPAGV
jgi:predicted nucleic acid-binding protein